jgi:shikimate dehydrogenase
VNATSIGLYPDVDSMPPVNLDDAHSGMLVCDVVFNPPETLLIRAARERGFELWTGQKAPEPVMKEALRRAMGIASR